MKPSQSASALAKWELVILGWLSDPTKPYNFTSPLKPSSAQFSLREAINGHITYRHQSIIDPDVLSAAWSSCKLSTLPDGTHQLAPRLTYTPPGQGHVSSSTNPASFGQQSRFIVSTEDIDILRACALLANAGVFTSNNVLVEVRTGAAGSEFLSSLPNDDFPNVASDQPDISTPTHYLL